MILLLWFFVIALGIAFDADLYEQRMIVPQWFSGSPQSRSAEIDDAPRPRR